MPSPPIKQKGEYHNGKSSCYHHNDKRRCDESRALTGNRAEHRKQFHQSGKKRLL